MKKEYNTPELEVTKFDVEDVITTASSLVEGNNNSLSYNNMTQQ